jgi:hypothetical protein
MKKTFTLLLLFISIGSFAQIQKERTYTRQTELINLGESGYKYAYLDIAAGEIKLYNLDHSIYRAVNLNVPSNTAIYQCGKCSLRENGIYITETLVNASSDVEVFYRTNEGEMRVVDENGNLVFNVTGISFFSFANTGTEYKLQVYFTSNGYEIDSTSIYSLSGSLPTSANKGIALESTSIYPNPAEEVVTINYSLPADARDGELSIIDVQGREIKTAKIDRTFNDVKLDVSSFKPGMYLYRISAGGRVVSTSKFIKQ